MKHQKEPPLGRLRRAADGSLWKKTEKLGTDGWRNALADAHFAIRTQGQVEDQHLEAMGYTKVRQT